MSARTTSRTTRAIGMAILSVLAPLVLFTGTANADGSGTVNDPWVPMRGAHTACDSTTLWGNYSGGSGHSDARLVLPRGTYIGVRYLTSDRNSGMVHPNGLGWGFMLRSCIAF